MGTLELITTVVGSTAAGGVVSYVGRWALLRTRQTESEATRVWARLEIEEKKRDALEEDVARARKAAEISQELVQAVRADLEREKATYRIITEELQAELLLARQHSDRCEKALAEATARITALEQYNEDSA